MPCRGAMTAMTTTPVNGLTLKNRVAVVTGSTSGIGLGVARTLATYGAAVLLNGFGSKAAIDTAIADREP